MLGLSKVIAIELATDPYGVVDDLVPIAEAPDVMRLEHLWIDIRVGQAPTTRRAFRLSPTLRHGPTVTASGGP